MPRISHEQKQLYKSKIRALISRDHQASQKEVQLRLEAEGLKLDRFDLAKLLKEIQVERTRRADRKTLAYALASFEDTMTETVRIAWEIATDPFTKNSERLMAPTGNTGVAILSTSSLQNIFDDGNGNAIFSGNLLASTTFAVKTAYWSQLQLLFLLRQPFPLHGSSR
jgi:arginine repressor